MQISWKNSIEFTILSILEALRVVVVIFPGSGNLGAETLSSHYAKSWKRPMKTQSKHNLFFCYKAAFNSAIRYRVLTAMSVTGISANIGRLLIMRPFQLRHGECSAKCGSASQWHYFLHYFSKKYQAYQARSNCCL